MGGVSQLGSTNAGTVSIIPASPNLLGNGTFDVPIGSTNGNWGIFPDNMQFPNQINNGVFEFYRAVGSSSGVVLQQSGDALGAGTGVDV